MRNFTSGEWKYREIFGTIYSGETVIAKVFDAEEPFQVTPEGQANARLILFAPEMYRILSELREHTKTHDIGSYELECEIREVLSKIENEPSKEV